MTDDWQIIPTHTWTRLHGHDLEICHQAGHNIAARVIEDHVEVRDLIDVTDHTTVTVPPDAPQILLRPPGGHYQLVPDQRVGTTTTLTFDTEDLDHD
jgi:hypothetical protein